MKTDLKFLNRQLLHPALEKQHISPSYRTLNMYSCITLPDCYIMNSHSHAFRILLNSKPRSLVDDAKPGPSRTLFPSHANDENDDDIDFSCISLPPFVDSPVSDELTHIFDLLKMVYVY